MFSCLGTAYLFCVFGVLGVFLPRDASAERGNATVRRPSVRLSVRLSVRP